MADYTGLRDVELRKSLEAEHGLFIAEGEKVIRRAVAAGYPVRSVLLTRRWLGSLADVLDGLGDRVHVVDDDVMEEIAGFPVHRGALASMERRELPSVGDLLHGALRGERTAGTPADPGRILILEDLVDHGNVGAIFRCAAALGIDAVVLSPRCADPLYRRSVKVSMGAVFSVPYARMADWYGGLAEIRAAGYRLLALTPASHATPLNRLDLRSACALMLGTEGDGLSSRWLHEADEAVRIGMDPRATARGVDSLNVVAAASIACYELAARDW
nr:RNA methyltransferase [Planomonospora venezuelensis]